jgi:hypothetical protein
LARWSSGGSGGVGRCGHQARPPSHAAQGAAIQVILIGLLLILVLLYRRAG